MAWIKLHNDCLHSPQMLKAMAVVGDSAFALWTAGLLYCNQYLTDGLIPREAVCRLVGSKSPFRVADALCDAGLWERVGSDYSARNYHKFATPSEVVSEKTNSKQDLMAKAREKRWAKQQQSTDQSIVQKPNSASDQITVHQIQKTDTDTEKTVSKDTGTRRRAARPVDPLLGNAWKVWRELYAPKYGRYTTGVADGKAMQSIVEVAKANLATQERPEGDFEELVRHWVSGYLNDRNEFLEGKRHGLMFLPKSIPQYGSPWAVELPPQREQPRSEVPHRELTAEELVALEELAAAFKESA